MTEITLNRLRSKIITEKKKLIKCQAELARIKPRWEYLQAIEIQLTTDLRIDLQKMTIEEVTRLHYEQVEMETLEKGQTVVSQSLTPRTNHKYSQK
jgi:hypothetical protein